MGVRTSTQLIAAGVSRGSVASRVRSGKLIRVLPQVYADEKLDYLGLCTAVTLWKSGAVISHLSAAWLWGLIEYEPAHIEATVDPSGQVRCPDWIRLYRRTLPTVSVYRGLRVVTIEQTFLDVSATLPKPQLEQFFDAAIDLHIPWRRVAEFCATTGGMNGTTALREQLRRCCPGTRSEPERRVARALTARNFRMEINARVGRFYGDLVDFRARVIVEIDGRAFHIDPATFTSDRRRQNTLVLDGWLVLRYSAATVMSDLDGVVEEILTVVRRRRKSINSPPPA